MVYKRNLILIFILGLIFSTIIFSQENKNSSRHQAWTTYFPVKISSFSDHGINRYMILEPGYQLILEGKEKSQKVKLIITVLDDVRNIDGVKTRVIEEREFHNGNLVEVSMNYCAIDKITSSIFYFGEDVDIYKKGKIVNHEGTWHAGEKGAKFGLMMPGIILIGARYFQEIAPKVAMDRAEIITQREKIKIGKSVFKNCLLTEESSPLEPGFTEYKVYAPGIGLIKDGSLKLVKYGFVNK